jgi:signal transduction histidine kinase
MYARRNHSRRQAKQCRSPKITLVLSLAPADYCSDTFWDCRPENTLTPMNLRKLELTSLLNPTTPPTWLGAVVAAAFIGVESAMVYALGLVEPAEHLGALYVVGILVIATFWRLPLALLTAALSAVAFDALRAFEADTTSHFIQTEKHHLVMHASMLLVAVVANGLAHGARMRAEEADQRRREADLAAELARVMLGGVDLDTALDLAARRLALVLQLPWAHIERGKVHARDGQVAILLCDRDQVLGTLLAPRQVPHRTLRRLRERVVPSLEALLRAACDRERINSAIEASNDKLGDLADQQAALRRIATLVARGVAPTDVFTAVVDEIARSLHVEGAALVRDKPDGDAALVAGLSSVADGGTDAAQAPIMVDGRSWGRLILGSAQASMPADTADRVRDFADLAATAIANAAARQELTASRARIVAASDDARRRLERDLHDGAQQRLETLKLEVRLAEDSVPDGLPDLREQMDQIVRGLTEVSDDLHEFSRGIHPAVLSSGLAAALRTLARRCAVPVALAVDVAGRLAESVEVTAYYVVAESLTNSVKHAQADEVKASARVDGDTLYLMIEDDGVGGADPDKGSGLIGLTDRVEAIGGRLHVVSPHGAGTTLRVSLPLDGHCAAS